MGELATELTSFMKYDFNELMRQSFLRAAMEGMHCCTHPDLASNTAVPPKRRRLYSPRRTVSRCEGLVGSLYWLHVKARERESDAIVIQRAFRKYRSNIASNRDCPLTCDRMNWNNSVKLISANGIVTAYTLSSLLRYLRVQNKWECPVTKTAINSMTVLKLVWRARELGQNAEGLMELYKARDKLGSRQTERTNYVLALERECTSLLDQAVQACESVTLEEEDLQTIVNEEVIPLWRDTVNIMRSADVVATSSMLIMEYFRIKHLRERCADVWEYLPALQYELVREIQACVQTARTQCEPREVYERVLAIQSNALSEAETDLYGTTLRLRRAMGSSRTAPPSVRQRVLETLFFRPNLPRIWQPGPRRRVYPVARSPASTSTTASVPSFFSQTLE